MTKPEPTAEFSKFPLKKRRFLEHFAECGCIGAASAHAGVSRRTHLNWKKTDRRFFVAFEEALCLAIESFEVEAARRAKDGVLVPVYQGGKAVGAIRKYSDLLLIFLLRAMNPEKYRDSSEHLHFAGQPNASDAEALRMSIQKKLERLAAQSQPPQTP